MVWNPNGFHLINGLSKGIKFNANHYAIDSLVPLPYWRKTQVRGNDRKLIIHADNARQQTARVTLEFLKHNEMKRAPHPPYSPNLATFGRS
jgi:hypothetical protein